MLLLQPIQPHCVLRSSELRFGRFGQLQEVLRVAPRQRLSLLGRELLGRVLPEHLEQPVSHSPTRGISYLLGLDERVNSQLLQAFQRAGRLADRFRRLDWPTASEDREPGEKLLNLGSE